MAFTDTKDGTSIIRSSDWNDFVDFAQSISSNRAWSTISGASDMQDWDSSKWHNSSIIWSNALQKWLPYKSGAGTGGSTTLEDLTDTTIPAPSSGQSLVYDGSTWIDKLVVGITNIDGGLSNSTYLGVSGSPLDGGDSA